jgi:hypothetical protein
MDDVRREKPHQGQIMDLQTNKDLTFLISSSKDCTAKVKFVIELKKKTIFF